MPPNSFSSIIDLQIYLKTIQGKLIKKHFLLCLIFIFLSLFVVLLFPHIKSIENHEAEKRLLVINTIISVAFIITSIKELFLLLKASLNQISQEEFIQYLKSDYLVPTEVKTTLHFYQNITNLFLSFALIKRSNGSCSLSPSHLNVILESISFNQTILDKDNKEDFTQESNQKLLTNQNMLIENLAFVLVKLNHKKLLSNAQFIQFFNLEINEKKNLISSLTHHNSS